MGGEGGGHALVLMGGCLSMLFGSGQGLSQARLYWELLASRYPQVVLGISKEDRKKIVQYILTYVFKRRSVPAPGSRGPVVPMG